MYRMKCSQNEIALCLFAIEKTKQWGVWTDTPISLTNKYKLYILCMLHSSRHGHYQGKLVLNNAPLIASHTLRCHTHIHALARAHTCTPTRSLTHKCTRAKEQITIGLQQWAIVTNEKESREQKKCVWKYPSLSLIGREKVAFWSKLIGAGWVALDI